jgi:hypothetical protein
MEKTIASLLLATLISSNCFASTIVVLWTPKAAMIGADAKQRRGDGIPASASPTCKLGEISNKVLWAQAGIRSADTPTRGTVVDFRSILAKDLDSVASLKSRIVQAELNIKRALLPILNNPSVRAGVIANPEKYGFRSQFFRAIETWLLCG